MTPTATTTFEQYVEQHEREARARGKRYEGDYCDCCGRKSKRLSWDGCCRECLKYMYGFDQAQAVVGRAILGGAVKGALKANVDAAVIRSVVDEVIDDAREQEADAMMRSLAEALGGAR